MHLVQKCGCLLYLVNDNPGAWWKGIYLSAKLGVAGEDWDELLVEEKIDPELGLQGSSKLCCLAGCAGAKEEK